MSQRLVQLAWETKLKRPTQKVLLLALAEAADDNGYSTPTLEELMNKTSGSRSAIRVARRELQDAAWLTIGPRTVDRRSLSNEYTLNVQKLLAYAPKGSD